MINISELKKLANEKESNRLKELEEIELKEYDDIISNLEANLLKAVEDGKRKYIVYEYNSDINPIKDDYTSNDLSENLKTFFHNNYELYAKKTEKNIFNLWNIFKTNEKYNKKSFQKFKENLNDSNYIITYLNEDYSKDIVDLFSNNNLKKTYKYLDENNLKPAIKSYFDFKKREHYYKIFIEF